MSARNIQRSAATYQSMLRWYPPRWRARYGEELAAMIEDDLAGERPTVRYQFSIARSGVHEHLREVGLIGNSASPSEQVRGGALTVLCAFALFVVPGVGFAKISEHWDQSIRAGSRHLLAVSYNVVASLAVACAVAIMLAVSALLPAFVRFVRAGGWQTFRRRIQWAILTALATVAIGGGLVFWARHLSAHQRNTGFGWYQFGFVSVAILFAATVATCAAAAVATARHLHIGLPQLKFDAVLAVGVALCMPAITAAAAIWWGSMATTAPWFLAGTRVGSSPSPLVLNLVGSLVVMTIASVAGIFGLIRVVRSWQLLRSG